MKISHTDFVELYNKTIKGLDTQSKTKIEDMKGFLECFFMQGFVSGLSETMQHIKLNNQ